MYTESQAVQKYQPPVYPVEQGRVIVADGKLEVTAAQIALAGLVGLVILPAGCVPIDFTLIEDDLDTGTALVQDVGVLNAGQTNLVASTNLITGATAGQAGGAARADALPDALCVPSETDRVIAVKTTTGGVLLTKSTGTVTSTGVDVTADDTVTINGKAYKFVASPGSEGDVDIGGTAAITLDNLKLAINRTDPTTNDGVKYKCAAAHPTVEATTNTDTVQTLQALTGGVAGDSLTLAKSAVTLSVSHDHLEGGLDAVPLAAGTIRGILAYRAACYDV
jgi:hypothetical protein